MTFKITTWNISSLTSETRQIVLEIEHHYLDGAILAKHVVSSEKLVVDYNFTFGRIIYFSMKVHEKELLIMRI